MLSLFVEGEPVPQGSKRAVSTKKGLRVVDESGKRLKDWREVVGWHAVAAWKDKPFREPVIVRLCFHMRRPNSHFFNKKRELVRESAPLWHSSRPDIDKLTRAVLDALTGPVIYDDSLVAQLEVSKIYSSKPGCYIEVCHAGMEREEFVGKRFSYRKEI